MITWKTDMRLIILNSEYVHRITFDDSIPSETREAIAQEIEDLIETQGGSDNKKETKKESQGGSEDGKT